jgi:hypothetical protein
MELPTAFIDRIQMTNDELGPTEVIEFYNGKVISINDELCLLFKSMDDFNKHMIGEWVELKQLF